MSAIGGNLVGMVNCFSLKLFMKILHCSLKTVPEKIAATAAGRFMTIPLQKYLSNCHFIPL